MVKRRTPVETTAISSPEDIAQKVASFAAGAEGVIETPPSQEADPNASRDYKSIRVPFNEHEYSVLDEAARLTGRSKLNFIRWAILQMAEQAKKDQ
jgi:hypothetical protein